MFRSASLFQPEARHRGSDTWHTKRSQEDRTVHDQHDHLGHVGGAEPDAQSHVSDGPEEKTERQLQILDEAIRSGVLTQGDATT